MTDLFLNLEQKQTLSQKMIQNIEILQMSAYELEVYLNNISLENPVIDLNTSTQSPVDISSDKIDTERFDSRFSKQKESSMHSYDHQQSMENITNIPENSLSEHISFQLIPFSHTEQDKYIYHFLVESLDEKGYLTVTVEDICQLFKVSTITAEKYVNTLQSVEPAGIGAHTLTECLVLQLKRLSHPLVNLSIEMLTYYIDNLARNQLKVIAQNLKIPLSKINEAYDLIKTLNPKPGNGFSCNELSTYVKPDIIVLQRHNNFQVTLNNDSPTPFSINSNYRKLLNHPDKEVREYLYQKFQQAEWINKCLEQRNITLLRIAQQLLVNQKKFFIKGPDFLKPLRQVDIGSQLELHSSTVSRAIHDKYLQCFWGVFPLKYFFSKAAPSNHTDLTSAQLKQQIKDFIDSEDKKHPLSDQKIVDMLAHGEIHIARRTVAKYRTELLIPDTSKRRSI